MSRRSTRQKQVLRGRTRRLHSGAVPSMLGPKAAPRTFMRRLMVVFAGIAAVFVLLLILSGVGVTIAYNSVAINLKPRLEVLGTHKPFQSSKIYDRNGIFLYEFVGTGRREPVKLSDVTPELISATIAIEDASFYENPGVNYFSIARATWANLTQQDVGIGGASTITQQVIRLIVLTSEERNDPNIVNRKFKEIVLAQELDTEYSKNEILELYLNEIPYGNLAYGIQAASQTYFDVNADELNLAQAALLAGLPQRPSSLDPFQYVNSDLILPGVKLPKDTWLDPTYDFEMDDSPTKIRQVGVLRQMVAEGYLTEKKARAVAAEDLQFEEQEVSLLAPHFVFYVKKYLENRYGAEVVVEGGLTITTTLDLSMQQMAQTQAYSRILELEDADRNIHNAAVVMMQPNTGQILAMVGSIGYNLSKTTDTPGEEGNVLDGKVNVTTAQRQPGSALKPFTYLSGMEQYLKTDGAVGLTPASVIWDVPTIFNPNGVSYEPENYDQKAHGPLRPRVAVANSLNIPAVKALKAAGIQDTLDLLHRLGIAPTSLANDPNYYGLALTLGGGEVTPLDLATAYNTLASGGRYYAPTPILKITDSEGKVLEEYTPTAVDPAEDVADTSKCVVPSIEDYELGVRVPNGTQCVDGRLGFIITNMISDNEARRPIFGLNSVLKLSQPAAVKTGTTNEYRDAWASGFTPFLTVTVWTGNNNNESTGNVESTSGGGVIWNRVMENVFIDPTMMQTLSEPYGTLDAMPQAFRKEYPGVFSASVCEIPGPFGGRDEELFVEGLYREGQCDLYEKLSVLKFTRTAEDGTTSTVYCRPEDGATYPGGTLTEIFVWKLPKSNADEKVNTKKWNGATINSDEEGPGGSIDPESIPVCSAELMATPTPSGPSPTPTPVIGPGQALMPDLRHYGEDQAKEILRGLGFTNIIVDYQGRDRLGPVFDQFAPYAVVSTSPGAGTVIDPSTTIVLGVRAPVDTGPPTVGPEPTLVPPPPEATPVPPPPDGGGGPPVTTLPIGQP